VHQVVRSRNLFPAVFLGASQGMNIPLLSVKAAFSLAESGEKCPFPSLVMPHSLLVMFSGAGFRCWSAQYMAKQFRLVFATGLLRGELTIWQD